MPLLRKGILMPVQGIDYSQPAEYIPDRGGFPQNMRFYRNEMRKRPGKTLLGGVTADGSQIMGFGKLELSSGTKHLVRTSKTKLEKYNTTTGVWDSINNTPFTGGDDDFFSFATVTESGLLVITNYIDGIRKWTGSGNNAILGGSPPKAKFCTYLSPYLLVAYTDDGSTVRPWGIDWCDTDAPEVWSGGNSGSHLASDEPSPIRNIAKLNEFVAVYKQDSLILGRKIDTSDIFTFDTIKTGVGLAASRGFAAFEGKQAFIGANDFYIWNGIQVDSIGNPVRDEVFSRIDRSKIGRCFAVHIQELTEIHFFVVITGNNWPTEIWKWNYRTGFWYFDTCSELTAAIVWERTNTSSWDDQTATWDTAQGIWDAAASVANWEDVVFGDKNGYAYSLDYSTTNDNDVAVSAKFETKDFVADMLEFAKRWLRIDIWAKGPGKLYVDYSTDRGDTWTPVEYSSSQTYIDLGSTYVKYEMYLDVISDKIRFRFRNAESGETFYLRNFYPYYLSQGEEITRRE